MTNDRVIEEADFLHAVVEASDDDSLRLVYADWLDGRGDPGSAARATLVRWQLTGGGDRRLNVAAADPAAVRAWQPLVPAGFRNFHYFDRGFPDVVFCNALDFVHDRQALLDRLPVRSVNLRDARGTVPALTDCPFLGRLRSLFIRYARLGDDDAFRLAACPALGHLAELDLLDNRFTLAGEAALTSSPYLRGVRLNLGRAPRRAAARRRG